MTLLLLTCTNYVVSPGKPACFIAVQVPLNPVEYIHVYPVDKHALSGATEAVNNSKFNNSMEHS